MNVKAWKHFPRKAREAIETLEKVVLTDGMAGGDLWERIASDMVLRECLQTAIKEAARVVGGWIRDPGTKEELEGNVWLQLARRGTKRRWGFTEGHFAPYIWQVMCNAASKEAKEQKKQQVKLQQLPEHTEQSAVFEETSSETNVDVSIKDRDFLTGEMKKFSIAEQKILWLLVFEKMKGVEIAKKLAISESTVSRTINRYRAHLESILGKKRTIEGNEDGP